MPARQTRTRWFSGTPDDLKREANRLLAEAKTYQRMGEVMEDMVDRLRCLECTVHIDVPRDSQGGLLPNQAYATHEFICPSNARQR